MKSIRTRLLCGAIALILLAASISCMAISASAAESDNIVITIDPGHGGDDPGNTNAATLYGNKSPEHYESRHVYDISLYVKQRLLQYKGVTVYLTREDLADTVPVPSLASRPNIAKEYNSDAFVSIHTNSFNTAAYGAEIHVPLKSVSYNNEIAVASHTAARAVLDSMVAQTGVHSRDLKYNAHASATYPTGETADNLAVIRGGRENGIPVVMLIETAFADNENDFNSFLSTTEKRKAMGYAIADGLADYYDLELISEAITPYFVGINNINGSDALDLEGNLDEGVILTDAKEMQLPTLDDKTVSLNGWLGADGGVSEYLYSVNFGDWSKAMGGADGEPSADYYGSLGLTDATKLGLFNSNDTKLVANLSKYEGQTVSVTFAARSAASGEVIPFLILRNYSVPVTPLDPISAIYGQKLSDLALPSGWTWADAAATVGDVGTNSAPVIFTASDSTAHNFNIQISVAKADPDCTVPENIEGQYKSKLSDISLPEGWAWSCGDTPLDEIGVFTFDAVYTPSDTASYNTVNASISVEVKCIEHIYENSCDTTCECGFTRETTHTYSNSCDAYCNACGFLRTPEEHKFSTPCDAYCDICSFMRTPEGHKYTNDCDTRCDVCNTERKATHTYDNDCDAYCNICNEQRDASHVYANDCDISCNICNMTRGVSHVFTDDSDTECDVCGAVRASLSVQTDTHGCTSSISGILAIITSIAVAFTVTRRKR